MNFFTKKVKYIILLFIISFFAIATTVRADNPDELIILDSFSVKNDIYANISINGLVKNGDNVDILVYIDGEYAGLANISQDNLKTSTFSFNGQALYKDTPYEFLLFTKNKLTGIFSEPTYSHDRKISTSSKDIIVDGENGNQKATSTETSLIKNDEDTKLNPPTLSSVTLLTEGKITIPKIMGFTLNGTSVDFYLDDSYHGSINNITTGDKVANFEYIIKDKLKRGEHVVRAVAINSQGLKSSSSNTLSFSILDPQIAESLRDETASSSSSSSISYQNEDISEKEDKNTENKALTSEKKSWLNFIIFVLFLAAVIVWIFLINRELTKKPESPKSPEDKE